MSGSTINFTNYPVSNRVPGVYEEVDPSKANTGTTLQSALIIGQQLAAGTFTPGVPVLALGVNDTGSKAGLGSMLAKMVARYRKQDPYSPVWLLPLADDPAASPALGAFVVAGTAAAAGTLPLYVGDDLVSVGITSGLTAPQVAAAIVTALGLNPHVPVAAGASVAEWAISTVYTANSFVANGANLYYCVTGGTSAGAGGGPTALTPSITDGTVTWSYAGPSAAQVTPWKASTAYPVNAFVTKTSALYVAAAAGTSASSGGPNGTGTGITDGSVTWNYVGTTAASAAVPLLSKNKGLALNDIPLAVAPLGAAAGQSVPAGLTVTTAAMAGGATNPSLTTPLLNLGSQPFDFIALPYNDTISTAALTGFLNFTTGRWSPTSMIYGHAFTAYRGTYGAAITFLSALNDANLTVMPFAPSSLTPYWLWAAALAGAAGQGLQGDNCVLPLRQVPLYVSPPAVQDVFTWQQNNQLLYTGGSTFVVNPDGSVSPQKVVTTMETNAAGVSDNAFLNIERMYTLAQVLRLRRAFLQTNFGRKALVSDGTQIPEGSFRVSAKTIQAAVIAYQYYLQNFRGLVQNADTFANNVQVQNAGNGLVKILAPDDLTNQLDVLAVLVQFVSS